MSCEIEIFQVDAFTDRVFGGNPAAVCRLTDGWLPDRTMQSIAAENNLSETAFLVAEGDGYDIRWFTPVREVDLCGHATLASGYVVMTHIDPSVREVRFNSRSGRLDVRREEDWLILDLPALPPQALEDWSGVADALGVEPREVLQNGKMLVLLDDRSAVQDTRPDMGKVAALSAGGIIITAPGDDCDFVSRFFAPAGGIPEDPVTGSAHSVLAPYWGERLGKTRMLARQISARGGLLKLELRGDRVWMTGKVVPYLQGRITI